MGEDNHIAEESTMSLAAKGKMRKVSFLVSILMGVTMSLIFSLVGTGLSGHFTVPAWAISFLISMVLSIIIGFVVPMRRITDVVWLKLKVKPNSFKGAVIGALVSDIIYTPIITIAMVFVMVSGANRQMDAIINSDYAKIQEIQSQLEQMESPDMALQGQIEGIRAEIAGISEHRPRISKELPLSLGVCFVLGFIVIMIVQPFYLKLAMTIHLNE